MEMGSPLATPSHAFYSSSGAHLLQAAGRPASWGAVFLSRGPPLSASQRGVCPQLIRHSSQCWVMLFITQCGISSRNRWFPNSCVSSSVFEVTLQYSVHTSVCSGRHVGKQEWGGDFRANRCWGKAYLVGIVNITIKNSFRKQGKGIVNYLSQSKEHLLVECVFNCGLFQ